MPHNIDTEKQRTDLIVAAENFRVAMVQSGALDKVHQDYYMKQLRALEAALQVLNYIPTDKMVLPQIVGTYAIGDRSVQLVFAESLTQEQYSEIGKRLLNTRIL